MNAIQGHKCHNPSCSSTTARRGGVGGSHQNVLQASIRVRQGTKSAKRNRRRRRNRALKNANVIPQLQQTRKY